MSGRPSLFFFCGVFLCFLRAASAHDGAESTVTARLQHNRLEVVVTMTSLLGEALIGDSGSDPEAAQELTLDRFNQNRERLQQKALNLYDVTAGNSPLIAQRAVASIVEGGHLQLVIFYPEPTEWPLRFHARNFENAPGYYTSSVEVFDQDEKLLGRRVLAPQYAAIADLSVDPNAPTPTPPTTVPMPTPTPPAVAAAAPSTSKTGWSWAQAGLGAAALGLGLAGWLALSLRRKTG